MFVISEFLNCWNEPHRSEREPKKKLWQLLFSAIPNHLPTNPHSYVNQLFPRVSAEFFFQIPRWFGNFRLLHSHRRNKNKHIPAESIELLQCALMGYIVLLINCLRTRNIQFFALIVRHLQVSTLDY